MYKVEQKDFETLIGETISVVGIIMKEVEKQPFSITQNKLRKFYIAFVTSDGKEIPNMKNPYPTSDTFIQTLVDKGMAIDDAKVFFTNLLKNLEYGTPEEMYQSASILATSYGYVLKPLGEQ